MPTSPCSHTGPLGSPQVVHCVCVCEWWTHCQLGHEDVKFLHSLHTMCLVVPWHVLNWKWFNGVCVGVVCGYVGVWVCMGDVWVCTFAGVRKNASLSTSNSVLYHKQESLLHKHLWKYTSSLSSSSSSQLEWKISRACWWLSYQPQSLSPPSSSLLGPPLLPDTHWGSPPLTGGQAGCSGPSQRSNHSLTLHT